MRSSIVAGGVLVGVAIVVTWVSFALHPDGGAATTTTSARSSAAEGLDRDDETAPAEGVAAPRAASLVAERSEELDSAKLLHPRTVVGPVVRGSIVVVDPRGETHERESGAFVLEPIDGPEAEDGDLDPNSIARDDPRRVVVEDGSFRLDARGATVAIVKGLTLGGHPAAIDKSLDLESDAPLALRAKWIPDVLLHVVDASSGAELSGVKVATGRDPQRVQHPGPVGSVDLAMTAMRSPFHVTLATSVDALRFARGFWVGADGREWKFTQPDFSDLTETTIALSPAATLVVSVSGVPDATEVDSSDATEPTTTIPFERRARLRLRRDDQCFADVLAASGEVRFEGLEPGDYFAAIEFGAWIASARVADRTPAKLEAGRTRRVALRLDDSAVPRTARLGGTLFIPAAWGDRDFDLAITPLHVRGATQLDSWAFRRSKLEPVPGRDRVFRWRTGPTLPGIYDVRVNDADFKTQVDVGASGRDDLALDLPEPAIVAIEFVDEETREPVDVQNVVWTRVYGSDKESFWGVTAMLRGDEHQHRCVGPVLAGRGRVAILHGLCKLVDPNADYDVREGRNEFTVLVHRSCGVRLLVAAERTFGRVILVEWKQLDDANRPDVDRTPLHFGYADAERSFDVAEVELPRPGRYHLEFMTPDGNRVAEPLEIDVPRGEIVKAEVTPVGN